MTLARFQQLRPLVLRRLRRVQPLELAPRLLNGESFGRSGPAENKMKTKLLTSVSGVMLSLASLMGSEVASSRLGLKPGEAKAKMETAAIQIATLRSNIVQTLVQLDKVRNPQNRQTNLQEFGRNLTSLE